MVILEGVGHGEVKRWNLYSMPDMKLISSNNFPKNTHGGAAVSHNCEYIVYGLRDNLCHVIKTGSGETTHVITDHGGWVDGIQFSPKSDLFITLCKDSTARAYDPVSGLLKHNNEFRGLYGSRCTFSNEGEIYILYSQIGLDADTPVAFDAKTGERLFNLHHGNGVSDILFSDDDQTLISGSRDFTAKMWDRNNTEFPLHSYNVGEWVMSVLMKPSHPDRLFLFSRNGDINIYDAEKELYVDGPYRGSKDLNIFNMKLKTKPEADYFLALNTPNAVALWPFSIPEVNLDNTENLVSFSAAVTGVTMDKSKALQVVANNVQSLKIKANLLSGDDNLKKWKDWLVKGHSSKNPFVKVKPTQVRQFLIAQNTLPSLEEVLCNYPMDRAVLKLYASKLDEFSNDPEIQDYKRQRYRVSAEWYKSISQ
jgi:WD40 repeat protein